VASVGATAALDDGSKRLVRVLQISKFFPPVMGGIEVVTWELAEGLNRAGITTDVLCANQRLRSERQRAAGGYQVMRAGSLGMALSTSMSPPMLWSLRWLHREYDVLHLHMPDPMSALALRTSGSRARVVVHWHSDVVRQRAALALYEPLQEWLLARADAVIATSAPYAAASGPLGRWSGKVRVIPIGISDNRDSTSAEGAAALRRRFRGRRIVFSLGRMTYYKGFDVLIEAALKLPDDCVVVIGGDGELLEPYRRLVARRGLAGKVHMVGHVPDDELASYFDACDVFCMPSTVRAEAYGVAIVEAMMIGKPVVATDIPGSGVPWVNVDGVTGYNVPVRQPEALADALRRLLGDEALRREHGRAARARYVDEFTAHRMTQRTIDLYRELVVGENHALD
jgi:glycosyltransferase involved in cell wall biosynthesis